VEDTDNKKHGEHQMVLCDVAQKLRQEWWEVSMWVAVLSWVPSQQRVTQFGNLTRGLKKLRNPAHHSHEFRTIICWWVSLI
jgi:hypothetical protein